MGHDQIAQQELAENNKHNECGVELTAFLEVIDLRSKLFVHFMLIAAYNFKLQRHKLCPGLVPLFKIFELLFKLIELGLIPIQPFDHRLEVVVKLLRV